MSPQLAQFILTRPCGFISDQDLPFIIEQEPLCCLLVRCGQRRFITSAQDCAGMIAMVESSGDYVRDVSFPTIALAEAHRTLRGSDPEGQRPAGQPEGSWSINQTNTGTRY